jgi:aspartyl-tRNA(Asn)/glutamyl-tRNA(Gln) amidotransferase subunit A
VLSAGYYDAYYVKAQKVRTRIVDDFKKAFETVDVIMTPTAPTPAFTFGEKGDILSMYLSDVFTVPINIAGVPALSLKAGDVTLNGKNIPVGIQLISRWFDEPGMYRVAKELESVIAQ